MPIHDWTRVTAGTFHAFHLSWISEIQAALNSGILPPDYYAQAEQIAGPMGPDVLTLQTQDGIDDESTADHSGNGHVATAPPRTRWIGRSDMDNYVSKRRTVVIRHASGDRIVALIEIVSPGNKASTGALQSFVQKAAEALHRGYHLLIVDLFPPGRRDPQGIHGAIWDFIGEEGFELPVGEPLTLAAYSAGRTKTAYVEPVAVGRSLPDMPLFLQPDHYVAVPLDSTYQGAYRGVPRKWKEVLEDKAPSDRD
jgi:hypothetical protein